MKIERLIFVLLGAAVVLLGSCSGENKSGGFGLKGFGAEESESPTEQVAESSDNDEEDFDELAEKEMEEAEEAEMETMVQPERASDLSSFIHNWNRRIKVEGSSPNVKKFAQALCRQISGFGPAETLENYTTYPGYSDYNEDLYRIEDKTSNGYIHCTALTQFENKIACCYWKRQNGHRLVALWLGSEHENPATNKHLLAFYDYDPSTGVMSPEEGLTGRVQNKLRGFDSYVVNLPIEGKNITISAFNYDYDGDSASSRDFTLRWNGNSFDF